LKFHLGQQDSFVRPDELQFELPLSLSCSACFKRGSIGLDFLFALDLFNYGGGLQPWVPLLRNHECFSVFIFYKVEINIVGVELNLVVAAEQVRLVENHSPSPSHVQRVYHITMALVKGL